jgi:GNAT superfamily N-acetyltransferase
MVYYGIGWGKNMINIIYRNLELKECDSIKAMNPSQYIKRAWREVDGKRQLIEINYQDPDWPGGYERHFNSLRETILGGGRAIGAFDTNNKLLGFATINHEFIGEKFKYVLLDQLFITLEHRNKGIGKKLFMLCGKVAKEWGADKIYICAGSAEETIAFYFAIGCKEAVEINKELYEDDPRDFQLEFLL